MKTKAKYVIVILFLCTIPLLRCDSLWNGKPGRRLFCRRDDLETDAGKCL